MTQCCIWISKHYNVQVCLSQGYCTMDPLLFETRAVGQECWPRCGSYAALKSISEEHTAMCTSPKPLLHWRNPGFGFHTDKILTQQSQDLIWQIIRVLYKQVQCTTLQQYLDDCDVIEIWLNWECDSTNRKEHTLNTERMKAKYKQLDANTLKVTAESIRYILVLCTTMAPKG